MKQFLVILTICLMAGVALAAGDSTGRIRDTETVMNDVWDDSNDALTVNLMATDTVNVKIVSADSLDVGTAIKTGQWTKATPFGDGYAMPLSSDSATLFRKIMISPLGANTCDVVIGTPGEYNLNNFGYRLTVSRDTTLVLPINKLTAISLDSIDGGSGVSWIGIVK